MDWENSYNEKLNRKRYKNRLDSLFNKGMNYIVEKSYIIYVEELKNLEDIGFLREDFNKRLEKWKVSFNRDFRFLEEDKLKEKVNKMNSKFKSFEI